MAKRVWIGGLLVLVLIGGGRVLPWVIKDRPVIEVTPSLAGVFSESRVPLRKGQRACIAPVPLVSTVRTVSVLAATSTEPVPLRVRIDAPGYRASARIPATWPSGNPVPVAGQLDKPPPGDLVGRVCITNTGNRAITLAGTDEPRSQAAAVSTVDGKPVSDLALTLSADPSSVLSRLGALIDRGADMQSLLPTFIVWLLAIAFLIGAPVAALYALATSFRESSAADAPTPATEPPPDGPPPVVASPPA